MPDKDYDNGSSVPLDEMMQRLKDRSDDRPSEGELVTREDGSQVMRVKKRKRRSDQPKREASKKKKKQLIIGIISSVAIILLLGVTLIFFLLKNNSSSFNERVNEIVAADTGATPRIDGLVIKPTSIAIAALRLEGKGSSYLKEISVRSIRGNKSLTSFFTGSLAGRYLTAATGNVHLQMPPQRIDQEPLLESGDLDFGFYSINEGRFIAGNPTSPFLEVKDTNIALKRAVDGMEVRFRGGALQFLDLPRCRIGTGFVTFDQGDLLLKNVALYTESEGSIRIEDRLTLTEGASVTTSAVLERVRLSELGLIQLNEILEGSISSYGATFAYTVGELGTPELAIPFQGGDMRLRGLPFLFKVSEVFDLIELQPRFTSEVEGILTFKDGGTQIERLKLVDTGRFAITGNVSIDAGGGLSGKLRIGIAERIGLNTNGAPILKGLDEKERGYLWADIELSGTVQSPRDNFAASLREEVPVQPASGGSGEPLDGLFRELLEDE